MYITKKALNELTPDEYRACHYLNLRGEGMMLYSLIKNRQSSRSIAIMAWDDNKLLGWALLSPHGADANWYSSVHQKRKSRYVAQFYVRVPCRGKGVGAALMREVNKLDATPTVIPHDRDSADFFASYRVVTDRTRRGLVDGAKRRKKVKLTMT